MSLKGPRYPPCQHGYHIALPESTQIARHLRDRPRALDGVGEIIDTGAGDNQSRIMMTSLKNATVLAFGDHRRRHRTVCFNRSELNQLLALYSRQVARAVWRDYAIDHREGMALFSVFRHSYAAAAYHIVKIAGSGSRPPQFMVLRGRQRLRTASTLADVLDYFRPRLTLVGSGTGSAGC